MQRLQIRLFRTLEILTQDGSSIDLGSPTARSLFAYLVLNHSQNIDRRRLAFLFWPRSTESVARRNLRQYLHRLRRALEPIDPDGQLIFAEANVVRFSPPADWQLDVAAFEAACSPPDEDLSQAVKLYTGDLLEEIYDDWTAPERERLARLYRQCLLRLIDQCEAAHQFSRAITHAKRYLALDPLLENAHLRLMRVYYAAGNRASVKQQFDQLSALLQEELGIEPLPEIVAAYEAMLSGEYHNHSLMMPAPVHPKITPPPRRPSGQPIPPLVGRESELAWLDAALAQAIAGQGSLCFVEGESGVGKTRLVTEWLTRLDTPAYVLTGRGHEFESMLPYGPLVEALRSAAAETIPWELFHPPPSWLTALVSLLPDFQTYLPGLDASRRNTGGQHHLVEGLGNFILTLALPRPLILYLDNLHWADGLTWNFLGYLAQRATQAQLLILAVARPEDMSSDPVRLVRTLQRKGLLQQWQLARLSEPETQLLARQLMEDDQLDPRFLRRLYEETEGNPFFIVETVRAVQEAGGDWTQSVPIDAAGQRPHFAIPLQVQAVIEARLDKLSDEGRACLGVAAALGREFSFQLLQEISDSSESALLTALDEWLARNLVRETKEGYDFTHEKISQVAYNQLSRARRQRVHHRIAEFLDNQDPPADPATLAHHYYLSDAPKQALPYLAQAGERALNVHSYAEAREFGLRAIGLLGRVSGPKSAKKAERIDLNLQLAQAYAFTGTLPKALDILQETEHLAESLGDIWRLARILRRSAQIFWLRGRPDTAGDYARRALRWAEELDDVRLRFGALRMLSRVSIALSNFDDAIAYLLRYISLAEEGPPPADLPVAYGYLGVAYARVGSWQRAITAAQTGVELARVEVVGATQTVARMQLAFIYAELREWERVLEVAEPIRDLWQETGMSPYAFMLRAVVGRALVYLGQTKTGLQEIQAALRWAETEDYRVLVYMPQLFLAQCQGEAGQYTAARGTAILAGELAAKAGDRWAEAVALHTQAKVAMRQSQPDWPQIEKILIGAVTMLRQVRARPDLARAYLTLRRLYDRAGQVAWAVDCHFRATTIFDELGMIDELQAAQGQAAGERTGAVVISGLQLHGPNVDVADSPASA